jgi:hypothetical protein
MNLDISFILYELIPLTDHQFCLIDLSSIITQTSFCSLPKKKKKKEKKLNM